MWALCSAVLSCLLTIFFEENLKNFDVNDTGNTRQGYCLLCSSYLRRMVRTNGAHHSKTLPCFSFYFHQISFILEIEEDTVSTEAERLELKEQ